MKNLVTSTDLDFMFEIFDQVLQIYTNADFASNLDSRRSTINYIMKMFGGPVGWKSQLQSIVALLINEVEIRATQWWSEKHFGLEYC